MGDKFLLYLAARKARALKGRQRFDDEIAEIDRAERLYRASGAFTPDAAEPEAEPTDLQGEFGVIIHPESIAPVLTQVSRADSLTIKERIKAALKEFPGGATSDELLAYLRDGGLPTLARSSLSPQLSRLKAFGHVFREGGRWHLRPIKAEAEGVSPPTAS